MTDTISDIIQGIVPIEQKDLSLLLEIGYFYLELQKFKEAEEIFNGVAALIPHSEIPHIALGHLYFSQGHFNPALKANKAAVLLNTESAPAHAAVGEVLFFLKKPDDAVTALNKAIQCSPESPAGEFAQALLHANEVGVFG